MATGSRKGREENRNHDGKGTYSTSRRGSTGGQGYPTIAGKKKKLEQKFNLTSTCWDTGSGVGIDSKVAGHCSPHKSNKKKKDSTPGLGKGRKKSSTSRGGNKKNKKKKIQGFKWQE